MHVPNLRYALRCLRRSLAFTAGVILTIAVGIGANTAVYNVVYTVLFRPLPFRDPSRLVQLWQSTPALPQLQVTVPDFQDWRKQTHGFEHMAAYTLQAMNRVTNVSPGEPEVVQATMATHDLFSTLGVRPLVGRDFTTDDEQSKQNVVLINETLWRRKFGRDPAVIGKALQLETSTFTIIGVVSSEQAFPVWADVWLPFSLLEPELRDRRKYHPLEVIGRLKPGVSETKVLAEIQAIAKQSAEAFPDTNQNVGVYLAPLSTQLTDEVRPALLLVWAAVGLVLLIACSNVAYLMMGRMIERRQEMAVRLAMGASRLQLVRHVLAESLLLALLGGASGATIAVWLTMVLHQMAADRIPRMDWSAVSLPAWMFTAGVAIFCGLLFALPSCWHALTLRDAAAASIKTHRTVTRQRSRFGSMLIAGELSLAFLVLAGSALLLRSFAALLNEDPGFISKNVLTIEVPATRYDWNKAYEFFDRRLLPSVRALPGVTDVAAVNSAPLSLGPTEHSRFATRFGIEGVTFPDGHYPVAQNRWVTPDYFRVLQIPLKRGRWLTEEDRGKPRFLINETLARQFFSNVDPTTKRLVLGVVDPKQTSFEVVGVVGDVREMGLDADVGPIVYAIASGPVMTLLVKTAVKPEELMGPIQKTLHEADPQIAVGSARTLDQSVDDSLARRRFTLDVVGIFGGLAAFLTGTGIYSVLSGSIQGRRREFGIRVAVGATRGSVVSMILKETAAVAIPGLFLGVILHLAFMQFMRGLIYRFSPTDPLSMVAAGTLLASVVLLSSWFPARRASAVDPGESLRTD